MLLVSCEDKDLGDMSKLATLQRRQVPGFEGYYSVREDGVAFSEAREIEYIDGRVRKIKEKMLKEIVIKRKRGTYNESDIVFRFSVENKGYSFSKGTLMKIVFPEKFPPVESLKNEDWRPAYGHPNYAVSNLGRVKRLAYKAQTCGIEYTEQEVLVTQTKTSGCCYLVVHLRNNAKQETTVTSRLMVSSFFEPALTDDEVVTYIDGNVQNLTLDNFKVVRKCRTKVGNHIINRKILAEVIGVGMVTLTYLLDEKKLSVEQVIDRSELTLKEIDEVLTKRKEGANLCY